MTFRGDSGACTGPGSELACERASLFSLSASSFPSAPGGALPAAPAGGWGFGASSRSSGFACDALSPFSDDGCDEGSSSGAEWIEGRKDTVVTDAATDGCCASGGGSDERRRGGAAAGEAVSAGVRAPGETEEGGAGDVRWWEDGENDKE
jgi:hypothetical protein